MRQCRLAEPGRTENKHMIERFTTAPRGLDEDAHLVFDVGLANVIDECFGANRAIKGPVIRAGLGTCQSFVFDTGHGLMRRLSKCEPDDVFGRLAVDVHSAYQSVDLINLVAECDQCIHRF